MFKTHTRLLRKTWLNTLAAVESGSAPLPIRKFGKSILQVPDTGTRVLDNTRPFLDSSIESF